MLSYDKPKNALEPNSQMSRKDKINYLIPQNTQEQNSPMSRTNEINWQSNSVLQQNMSGIPQNPQQSNSPMVNNEINYAIPQGLQHSNSNFQQNMSGHVCASMPAQNVG